MEELVIHLSPEHRQRLNDLKALAGKEGSSDEAVILFALGFAFAFHQLREKGGLIDLRRK